jgi:hypothetical protein
MQQDWLHEIKWIGCVKILVVAEPDEVLVRGTNLIYWDTNYTLIPREGNFNEFLFNMDGSNENLIDPLQWEL